MPTNQSIAPPLEPREEGESKNELLNTVTVNAGMMAVDSTTAIPLPIGVFDDKLDFIITHDDIQEFIARSEISTACTCVYIK